MKGRITIKGNALNKQANKNLVLKNKALFKSCISKINNTFLDNAEDLNIFISTYNLLEYSDNYSMTSGKLWNYYREEVNDVANGDAANYRVNNNKTTTNRYFEYKTKITGKTSAIANRLNTKVVIPLKYFSNFCRFLDLPLINFKTKLDLLWSKDCVISKILWTSEVPANPDANPSTDHVPPTQTSKTTFQTNNAKLYVPVVPLSINDNVKFLENIKQGLKRKISWNKYLSETTRQPNYIWPNPINLDYLTDSTFRNINRLHILSFKNGDNNPTGGSLDKYYMPLVEIKDFNALIDNKPFFDQPI